MEVCKEITDKVLFLIAQRFLVRRTSSHYMSFQKAKVLQKIKYAYFNIKYFAKKHALTNGSVQRNYC